MSAASPSAPFPKILVCTDGSPDSEGAITAALNLAKTTGSTVFLLEVLFYLAGYELQAPDTLAPPIVNMELMQAQETAVRERLEARKTEAAREGVTLEPRVRTGSSAYEGILEEAGESQPDLIIMGRHGYTGLTRLLMGSVTARVIGHSPCDVLVVPQGVAPDTGIVQQAIKNEVDLIIVGSYGRTGLKKLLMGSVTERVIGGSPCPILVVKQPG